MPSMANIVVKKHDGTTDVTYTGLVPSAGDKTPAEWRDQSLGSVASNRPKLLVKASSSANGQARIVSVNYSYPETMTDSTTGVVSTRARVTASLTFIVPQYMADASINEAATQFGNLIDSSLINEVLRTGFAPV